MERLIEILENAYALAMGVQDDAAEYADAETVAAECAEFLAHLHGDTGAFDDDDAVDQELATLAAQLNDCFERVQAARARIAYDIETGQSVDPRDLMIVANLGE